MNASAESPFGASSPILTSALLARQYELNFDYLELLIAEQSLNGNPVRYLPDRVLDSLMECSIDQRQALATARFSLYSLGFEDQQFWLSALRTVDPTIDARYGVLSSAVLETAFCEIALVHAWHVAVTQPVAASMLYGMPTLIVNRMNLVQLWQLKRIAADYPGLLMPRWPSNPCFWPDMIKFARAGDLQRLNTVQQLGHQLTAVELQHSAAPRSAVRQRQRNLLLQRLKGARGRSTR